MEIMRGRKEKKGRKKNEATEYSVDEPLLASAGRL